MKAKKATQTGKAPKGSLSKTVANSSKNIDTWLSRLSYSAFVAEGVGTVIGFAYVPTANPSKENKSKTAEVRAGVLVELASFILTKDRKARHLILRGIVKTLQSMKIPQNTNAENQMSILLQIEKRFRPSEKLRPAT